MAAAGRNVAAGRLTAAAGGAAWARRGSGRSATPCSGSRPAGERTQYAAAKSQKEALQQQEQRGPRQARAAEVLQHSSLVYAACNAAVAQQAAHPLM